MKLSYLLSEGVEHVYRDNRALWWLSFGGVHTTTGIDGHCFVVKNSVIVAIVDSSVVASLVRRGLVNYLCSGAVVITEAGWRHLASNSEAWCWAAILVAAVTAGILVYILS